ncbi:unnamed protein product, partial [Rotaria magnacalcarata]
VAGGNGEGDKFNQLKFPTYLFVDRQQNVYVSDNENHRVMKWTTGSKESEKKPGTVIVGGNSSGAGASQFNYPIDLSFDRHGNLYVVDMGNHHVQRFYIE